MTLDQIAALVGKAGPSARLKGTAVVRKPDGSIRYDKDAKPGNYYEKPEDLEGLAITEG